MPSVKLLNLIFMLKEILAVSGKPGLYKLISRGDKLTIVESLVDKKRIPVYTRDKVMSIGEIFMYTNEEEIPLRDVLTAIKEKEGGKNASIDIAKAQADDLRNYLSEVLPDFDRERVYPSDIKKLLKWYELLIANDITDFSLKEDKMEEDVTTSDEEVSSEEDKKVSKDKSVANASATKRKDNSMTSAKPTNAPKSKSTPKTSTPKKSVVGAKRGG